MSIKPAVPQSCRSQAGDGFLSDEKALFQTETDLCLIARYDQNQFTHDMYAATGIACPDDLVGAVEKRRAEYLAGRMMAQRAAHLLGAAPVAPSRVTSGVPQWPKGLRGSISHARGQVAVWLTTRTNGLADPGLDIEHLVSVRQSAAIRQVVLTDAERAMGLNQHSLTVAFSGKEAIFKALFAHVGRRFGFNCAELCNRPENAQATFRLTRTLGPFAQQGLRIPVTLHWSDTHVVTWCRPDLR